MAIIEYNEGEHPAGFVGLRVVTTIGVNSEYRQTYLSYRDYPNGKARALADSLNEKWRAKALDRVKASWLSEPKARAGKGWLATGFRADLMRESKYRAGKMKTYLSPVFVVDGWPRQSGVPTKSFRVNVQKGRSIDRVYQAAVSHYVGIRGLGFHEKTALLARAPSPDLFVKVAISAALKNEYVIDINAIRRRVGAPEL